MCAVALFSFASCLNDDGEQELTIDPLGYTFAGDIIVDQNDGTTYAESDVRVQVNFDETKETATLIIYNIKFAEAMPVRLDMIVDGLVYLNNPGFITLGGNNIVPFAMGGPFPAYTVRDFIGQLTTSDLVFTMTCGEYPVSYVGKIQ